jgi:hypothetical protein
VTVSCIGSKHTPALPLSCLSDRGRESTMISLSSDASHTTPTS